MPSGAKIAASPSLRGRTMEKPLGKNGARAPLPAAGRGAGASLKTVKVPVPFEPLFLKAQDYVTRYFSDREENPTLGSITISGERYVLLRAASMSVEFFDLVMSLYKDKAPEEARSVASNILFDVAHAIGKADARAFHERMGVTDPIEKLSAGPIHFSFAGWAFVDISPESRPSPDEDFFLIYDHPFAFESDTWRRKGRKSSFPVCIMNAGYSSGWCEESFGLPLVAVEIACLAAGGDQCRFIMAPPSRIEGHLARHPAPAGRGRAGRRVGPQVVPEFFQRKRMEEELRKSHESLEARVRERTAELTEMNALLRREIAERKRAEEVRDEFLSVAAHELKTPLTSLRGFAQLLLGQIEEGRAPDPARLQQALSAIDRQSRKLGDLVTQLLDVSRLQAGQLGLQPALTDVVPLVQAVLGGARSSTDRHAIAFRGPASLAARVDPLRLEQVLLNLVDNAIKYSPDGGPIEVVLAKEGHDLQITVTDEGIGVPPEHRERIFDRFYQAHGERRFGGLGLGLYISRQISELHGGALEAVHPRTGGTWIILRLPLRGPPEAAGHA
jgi:signal transduction histidine kinase